MKLDPYLIPLTEIKSIWIKDLNVRPKPINLLEENAWRKILHTGLGNDFLDIPKAQATK